MTGDADELLTPSDLIKIIGGYSYGSDVPLSKQGRIDKLCQFGIDSEILNDKSRSLFISQLKSYLSKYRQDSQERSKIEQLVAIGLTPLQAYNAIFLPVRSEDDLRLICSVDSATALNILNILNN